MTPTATYHLANPATDTGPARVATPASNDALPCSSLTRTARDACHHPPQTATCPLLPPLPRTKSQTRPSVDHPVVDLNPYNRRSQKTADAFSCLTKEARAKACHSTCPMVQRFYSDLLSKTSEVG